jgi:hypothetical protein
MRSTVAEGGDPATSISDEAAEMGMQGVRVVEMNGDETVMDIVELCDPRREIGSEKQFIEFWNSARRAIDAFLAVHGRARQTA